MADSAKKFFDSLADRANGSHSADFEASYVFVIEGAGTWTVNVEGGKVSVSEGDHEYMRAEATGKVSTAGLICIPGPGGSPPAGRSG